MKEALRSALTSDCRVGGWRENEDAGCMAACRRSASVSVSTSAATAFGSWEAGLLSSKSSRPSAYAVFEAAPSGRVTETMAMMGCPALRARGELAAGACAPMLGWDRGEMTGGGGAVQVGQFFEPFEMFRRNFPWAPCAHGDFRRNISKGSPPWGGYHTTLHTNVLRSSSDQPSIGF